MSALTFETLSAELTQALAQQQATPPKTVARCTLGRDKVMVLVEYPLDSATAEPLAKQTLDWLEQHLRTQFDTTGLPEEAVDLSEEMEEVAVQLYLKHLSEAKPFTMRSFTWKVDDGFADLFGESAAIALDTESLDTESLDTEALEIETLGTENGSSPSQLEVEKPRSNALSMLSEEDEDERVLLELEEDHLPSDLEPDPEGLEAALDDDLGFKTELGSNDEATTDAAFDTEPGSVIEQNGFEPDEFEPDEFEPDEFEPDELEPGKSELDFSLDLDTRNDFTPDLSANSEAALEADLSLGVPRSEHTPNASNEFSLPGEAPKIESADLDLPTVHSPPAMPSADGASTSDFFDLDETLPTNVSRPETIDTLEVKTTEIEALEIESTELETPELETPSVPIHEGHVHEGHVHEGRGEIDNDKQLADADEQPNTSENSETAVAETTSSVDLADLVVEDTTDAPEAIAADNTPEEDTLNEALSIDTLASEVLGDPADDPALNDEALTVESTDLSTNSSEIEQFDEPVVDEPVIDEPDFHESDRAKSDGIVSDDWVPDDLSDLSLDPAEVNALEPDSSKVDLAEAEEEDYWATEAALPLNGSDFNNISLDEADLDDIDLNNASLDEADLDDIDLDNVGLNEADLDDIDLGDADINDTDLDDTDLDNSDTQPAAALNDDFMLYEAKASEFEKDEEFEDEEFEDEEFEDKASENEEAEDLAYYPDDESSAYYLEEENELLEDHEDIAAIDEAEVQQQREQWRQQTKRNPWMIVGALGFLLLGVLGFIFTRPCTLGSCDRIETAQQQGNEALSDLRVASTLAEVTEVRDQLDSSIEMLEPIPAWSSYYDDAQVILPGFRQELTALDLVTQAQGMAYSAALKSIDPPHPTATWETVADEWREAIAALSKVPLESPVREIAERKLKEYRANLSTILLRIEIESGAELSLRQAQSAASQASQQAEQASSLEAWEAVLANWNEAVGSLKQVPQGTQAYAEAQQILPEYEDKRLEARDRVEQERSASRILSQAQQLATGAQSAEAAEQWTVAIENWTQAAGQLRDIPAESSAHTSAQNQLATYTAALGAAETNAAASLRFQPVEPSFYLMCGTSDAQKCTYAIQAGKVRLALAEGYDRVINESITPPDQRQQIESNAQLVSQSNQLLEQISTLSRQAQIPIELYDSKGNFLAKYQPNLAGFVRQ